MWSRIARPALRKASGARNYHAPAHFKPPTMNDLPVPGGSWQQHYNSQQRKYNMHLIGGITFATVTVIVSKASGHFDLHMTPPLKPFN